MKTCPSCSENWNLVGREYHRDDGKVDYFCLNCKSKRKFVEQYTTEKGRCKVNNPEVKTQREETKDKLHITVNSYHLRTLEDLERHSEVDTTIWEIDRFITNSWEVTSSGKNSSTGKDQTYTNYQIKAWWKRRETKEIAILEWINNINPSPHIIRKNKPNDSGLLHEICIFDHHFGKYAWGEETGENCDLKILKNRFVEAVCDLSLNVIEPERILFPLGNDILHINNDKNMTYKGTLQDVDTRLKKIYLTAFNTIADSLITLSGIAPVDVLWIGSNHDSEVSWYLCHALSREFRNNDNISIDTSPKMRKAYGWGINGIFFDHGEIPPQKLVPILSSEFDDVWGGKKIREAHCGHYHKKKEISFTTADTYGPLIYRNIPSLTGTDSWHYKNGFIGAHKAAMSFVWDKYDGLMSYHNHNLIL